LISVLLLAAIPVLIIAGGNLYNQQYDYNRTHIIH